MICLKTYFQCLTLHVDELQKVLNSCRIQSNLIGRAKFVRRYIPWEIVIVPTPHCRCIITPTTVEVMLILIDSTTVTQMTNIPFNGSTFRLDLDPSFLSRSELIQISDYESSASNSGWWKISKRFLSPSWGSVTHELLIVCKQCSRLSCYEQGSLDTACNSLLQNQRAFPGKSSSISQGSRWPVV